MFEIDKSRFIFKTKEIWFSDIPFDIAGYDEVTFYECTRDVDLKGFSKEPFTTVVIDLTQDLEIIRKKMHRSLKRYIGYAQKDGVIIRVNEGYDEFYKINSEFREAKGLSKYNIDIDFMKKNGILFVSEYEGNILGGTFYIKDEENMRGLVNSTRRLESESMNKIVGNANRLMFWEAICYAKDCGMSTFDLGGYYTGKEPDPQKERINKFKDTFGGEIVTHYTYQKDYSMMYHIGKKILSIKKSL